MKTLKIFIPLIVVAFLIGSCEYSFIVPEDAPTISVDPNDPNAEEVKFSQHVLPIFTNNNNCTSCHKTGSQLPDLTAENAYSSLNSTRYINGASAENSLIYSHIEPESSTHPQKKYTANEASIVLAWIKQGAKNN